MLNATLSRANFYDLRKSDQAGFKYYRVVTIPSQTEVFKLTAGDAPEGRYGVSPWWSPKKPFLEDKFGIAGLYAEAMQKQMTLAALVRVRSAVKMEFNSLDNYVEIKLKQDTKAFWGPFATMNKWDKAEWATVDYGWMANMNVFERRKAEKRVAGGAFIPEMLGVQEAWQFYIPSLMDIYIMRVKVVNASDMDAMGRHLNM